MQRLIITNDIMSIESIDFLSKGILAYIKGMIMDGYIVENIDSVAVYFGITKKTLRTKLTELQNMNYISIQGKRILLGESMDRQVIKEIISKDETIDMFSPEAQKLAEIELLKLLNK